MKLVAPNVGWALYDTTVFWTSDGGAHWRDITPKLVIDAKPRRSPGFPPRGYHGLPEIIADVFFLDTRQGWVLFCCGQSDSTRPPDDDSPQYDLAMTTDAGTTWSIAGVTLPDGVSVLAGDGGNSGHIEFVDSRHGWMNLTGGEAHSSWGTLLATSDGGRTWRETNDRPPGGADPFYLLAPTVAWQVSLPSWDEPNDQELFVTRDGAQSWHKVTVRIPKDVSRADDADDYYDLPIFEDSKHGFLRVTCSAHREGTKAAMVLFETRDGGRTWHRIGSSKTFPRSTPRTYRPR